MASIKSANFAKTKIAAVALSNEKMEEIRNMPYDLVSTKHGAIYPPGELLDLEAALRNGVEFDIKRIIAYVDDPYDGNAEGTIANKPKDLYPYDYKRIEVGIYKKGTNSRLAFLSSNMAGKAAETPSDTGIIKVCVIDSSSNKIEDAVVTITNPTLTPAIDIQVATGADGCIMVPNLPPDEHNQYHVGVTKAGFSTDSTYPRTPQNPNSTAPDLNVLSQQVTDKTLIIDKISTLTIDVTELSGPVVPNANIHIEGKKLKWFNPSTPKYSADLVADSSGHLEIGNLEFDDYAISVADHIISVTSPYQPVSVEADVVKSVKILVASSADSPVILDCQPRTATIGVSSFALTVTGNNLDGALNVKLKSESGDEVVGSNIVISKDQKGTLVVSDFDLSQAVVGQYDLVVVTPSGEIKQTSGFEIK